ncbi:MAG: hypothetical protein AAF610_02600 [Pseudomonadota bacterium]
MEHNDKAVAGLPALWRSTLLWLLVLFALLPALKASTLFPTSWVEPVTGRLLIADTAAVFSWLGMFIGFFALLLGGRSSIWLALTVALAHWSAFAGAATSTTLFSVAYSVLALALFIAFALRGRANSLAFAGFLFASGYLTWRDPTLTLPTMITVWATMIVFRIAVEAGRQNWPLVKQLGRSDFTALATRTLILWWPMLFFIGAGLWLGEALKTGTENALYDEGIVTPYCAVEASGDDAVVPCTRQRLQLNEFEDLALSTAAFRPVNKQDQRRALSELARALALIRDPKLSANKIAMADKLLHAGEVDGARRVLRDLADALDGQPPTSDARAKVRTLIQLDLDRSLMLAVGGEALAKSCVLRDFDWTEVQSEPAGDLFRCPPTEKADSSDSDSSPPVETIRYTLSRLPFFDSAYRSIDRDYAMQRFRLAQDAATAKRKARGRIGRAREGAQGLFSVVPESTGLRTRRCGFLEVKCGASNYVITELNDAYGAKRRDAYRAYASELNDLQRDANGDAGVFLTEAHIAVLARLMTAREQSLKAVRQLELGGNALALIIELMLVVAVIKSLLYVFARVIFDRSTDIKVELTDDDASHVSGSIRHTAEIEIPADYPHDIYYKPNFQPLGPAARFSIPQWTQSWLARLRFGAWHMSRADFPLKDESALTFNAVEAEHLVDWEMVQGEEVVFRYGNFVAMNANVQLKTVYSLRVSNLLLGRLIWHTARCDGGPGRLILRTRGKPATEAQVNQSIPAARLIAWNRSATFSIDSHLTPQDVFLNGFNLRRTRTGAPARGLLVVEADARDGGLFVGTLRFVRNFLLPV